MRQSSSRAAARQFRVLSMIALCAILALGATGCAAPLRPQPGCGALRVEVKAQPKAGFRDAGGGAAYGDDGQPLVRPGYERVDYRNLQDIVVWLTPNAGASDSSSQSPAEPVSVTLRLAAALKADVPPVVAVARGATLTIINDTTAAEETFSVSKPNHFDLGSLAAGASGSTQVREVGTFDLLIGSRETPIATVCVAPTRWVRTIRSNAAATFDDVPPGPCRVSAWHPRFPQASSITEINVGESRSVTLKVGVNELPKQ